MHGGHIWLAIIGLANSGVACFYYLRLLAALYSRRLTEESEQLPVRRLSFPAVAALAATGLATLILGIAPGRVLNMVQHATPSILSTPLEEPTTSTLPALPPTDSITP